MPDNRALLFPDWDVDALVMNMVPDQDDDFSHALELLQQGQFDEVDQVFAPVMGRVPWMMMAAAYLKLKQDKVNDAKRLFRAVTLIAEESVTQLWAWHNLRRLEYQPPASLANQVLGIVIEVPYEGSADVLASYADGTARYINHQGSMIVWDQADELITPLIFKGIGMARPMGTLEQFHLDDPVGEGEVRLSTLTPAGLHIWEGSPEAGSDVARLFAQQAELLRSIVQKVLSQRQDGELAED